MKLNVWYKNLKPLKQLGISFLANWIIWFIASLTKDKMFFDEKHSLIYHIFDAIWMAFFMTILFNWKKAQLLFKSNNGHNA